MPPQELEFQNGSVYAKSTIHRGTKYGPYPVKWTNEPIDKHLAWEVSSLFIPFYTASLHRKKI